MTKPLLLAGGSGARLWPLSRVSFPKQFSKLLGDRSLFEDSALCLVSTGRIQFTKPVTVTNSEFCFIISEQLQQVDIDPGPIVIEPKAKNTAPVLVPFS